MTDPIADMLTRIRNGTAASRKRVDIPASRLKTEIARILQSEGYIQSFKMVEVVIFCRQKIFAPNYLMDTCKETRKM